MRKTIFGLMAVIFFVFSSLPIFAAANSNGILGSWVTYDLQKTPRSIVNFKLVHGEIFGSIVKILPAKGGKPTDLCTKCSGKNFNKPKVGMIIIWDLEKQDKKWKGKVLDTDSGNTYNCYISLSDDNQQLYLHAYKGITLFGATVTWYRTKK